MDELNVTDGVVTGADGATDNNNVEGQEVVKTYSADELQAETDRRVSEALKTAKANWEKDYNERLEKEKAEAAEMAKMSAEERAKKEFENEKQRFADEQSKYNRERLEFECTKKLAAANLPVEFATMLTGSDTDATNANIANFTTAFNKAVENAVNSRMKSEPPKVGTGGNAETDPFLMGFKN